MEKLRLLLLKDCNKNCEGCCNKDWDLNSLPECHSYYGFKEIMLTGGEPMLKPRLVIDTALSIRQENPQAKIYLYTADVTNIAWTTFVLSLIDGICVTLHDQEDVEPFYAFAYNIKFLGKLRSLRLNVFNGITIDMSKLSDWNVKANIEWIENCPLPYGEVFMKLKERGDYRNETDKRFSY